MASLNSKPSSKKSPRYHSEQNWKMAVYEALTYSTSSISRNSAQSILSWRLLALALAGPERVWRSTRRYGLGSNERTLTRQIVPSLVAWLFFVLCGGVVIGPRNVRRRVVDSIRAVMHSLMQTSYGVFARTKTNMDRTSTTTLRSTSIDTESSKLLKRYEGSCQCGAVQFQVGSSYQLINWGIGVQWTRNP